MNRDSDIAVIRARGLIHDINSAGLNLRLLDSIDLAITAGESVAILGASGSGKTTLLGLLAGLDRASGGEIDLLGAGLSKLDEDQRASLRAGQVGFVFQSFQLLPELTALENVQLPMEIQGHGDPAGAANRALESVGLGERKDHLPRQLSGGEQQRVAIARAYAPQPKVLFADEPTGNLDDATGAAIIDLLFELNRQHQTTMLLVTHDAQLAGRCNRRLRLLNGKLEKLD